MRLSNVTVERYRSIAGKSSFNVGNYTVLLGPNNQGKSNLLRAMVLSLQTIEQYATGRPTTRPRSPFFRRNRSLNVDSQISYEYDTDFPRFPSRSTSKSTKIELTFELSNEEIRDFKKEIGININGILKVSVSWSAPTPKQRTQSPTVRLVKSGTKQSAEKNKQVAQFISERIKLIYIPAVRPQSTSMSLMEQMLKVHMDAAKSARYDELLQELSDIEREQAEAFSKQLKGIVSSFLPSVKKISIETLPRHESGFISEITIDDGIDTPLLSKGDGVQNLLAIALALEWAKVTDSKNRQLLIATEEPESHLHPGAIRDLHHSLRELSNDQQVLVTTHNQGLINRDELSQNIIVSERTASAARKIEDIRTSLGIHSSDALTAAPVVLVCEGLNDERALKAILTSRDKDIAKWISSATFAIESVHGSGKIRPTLDSLRRFLSHPILIIDGDKAGLKELNGIKSSKLISDEDIILITRAHGKHSEFEDLLSAEMLLPPIQSTLGLSELQDDHALRKLIRGDSAWSERAEAYLAANGCPDPKGKIAAIKAEIAERVETSCAQGINPLNPELEPQITRLIERIRCAVQNFTP